MKSEYELERLIKPQGVRVASPAEEVQVKLIGLQFKQIAKSLSGDLAYGWNGDHIINSFVLMYGNKYTPTAEPSTFQPQEKGINASTMFGYMREFLLAYYFRERKALLYLGDTADSFTLIPTHTIEPQNGGFRILFGKTERPTEMVFGRRGVQRIARLESDRRTSLWTLEFEKKRQKTGETIMMDYRNKSRGLFIKKHDVKGVSKTDDEWIIHAQDENFNYHIIADKNDDLQFGVEQRASSFHLLEK